MKINIYCSSNNNVLQAQKQILSFKNRGETIAKDEYEWGDYKKRLEEAIAKNPTIERFFADDGYGYDGYVYLYPIIHDELGCGRFVRTHMKIIYKHPLYPNRKHITVTNDNVLGIPAYVERDTIDISADGKTYPESFNNLIDTIETQYKEENTNVVSEKLNKTHERIQREIQVHEIKKQAKQAEKQNRWYNRFLRKLKGE